jgi:hypothetical protein
MEKSRPVSVVMNEVHEKMVSLEDTEQMLTSICPIVKDVILPNYCFCHRIDVILHVFREGTPFPILLYSVKYLKGAQSLGQV